MRDVVFRALLFYIFPAPSLPPESSVSSATGKAKATTRLRESLINVARGSCGGDGGGGQWSEVVLPRETRVGGNRVPSRKARRRRGNGENCFLVARRSAAENKGNKIFYTNAREKTPNNNIIRACVYVSRVSAGEKQGNCI